MPLTPFMDMDVGGYLNPALKLLSGGALIPQSARGICYPIFAWFAILIYGSLDGISFVQHLLSVAGLVLIALSCNLLMHGNNVIIKRFCILLLTMVLGFNYELIVMEHTIHPEGVILFLTGTIFFLLLKVLKRYSTGHFFALQIILVITTMLLPKFTLACAFTGLYVMYKCWDAKAGFRRGNSGRMVLLLLMVATMFSIQYYFNRQNENVKYFLPMNFFYVNAKTISSSAAFETCFSANEKDAVNIATDSIIANPSFHLLGFNPDVNQYGPLAEKIETQFGKDIYTSVMFKALLFCEGSLLKKAINQIAAYYFGSNKVQRVPLSNSLNFRAHVEESTADVKLLSDIKLPVYSCYVSNINSALLFQATSIDTPFNSVCYNFVYRCVDFATPFLIFLFLCYSVFSTVLNKETLPIIVLIFHFLSLFLIAFIHTLDLNRYCYSLFPFLVLITILSLYYFLMSLNNACKRLL